MNQTSLAIFNSSLSVTASETENSVRWRIFPVVTIMIISVTAILNILVLLAFLKSGTLRTPFNIYLANLMTANILHVIMVKPFDVASNVLGGWKLGYPACTYYLYSAYIINSVILHAHMLITLNRIWAVTFPISYKYRHTKVTALCICGATWLYVNILLVPEIIRDALWYRYLQVTPLCLVNGDAPAQYAYVVFTEFWCYVLPAGIIIGAFPYIMYKRRSRSKINAAGETGHDMTTRNGKTQTSNLSSAHHETTRASGNAETGNGPRVPNKSRSNGYTILTALTISVAICWTPHMVFFKLNLLTGYYDGTFYQIAAVLFMIQAAADPIYFIATLTDIRFKLKEMLYFRRCFL